jgi:hypothetical protein
MYSDPSNIRRHVVKIRLNDREAELLDAWNNYTGQQKAVVARDMLLEQARLDLEAAMSSTDAPQLSLFRA